MKTVALLTVCVVLAACTPQADPQPPSVEDAPQSVTLGLQCGSYWKGSPHMRAFYDETVATFANGMDVDVDAYEARVFAIFRDFVRAHRLGDEKVVEEWWGLIPRQMASIVREDPTVLESYDAFWIAYAGPD